jgi:hypothetical protein|tara:strand:- start:255 stop:542 length:288 start_codon:yes stop_codon:yes gene_type:complete
MYRCKYAKGDKFFMQWFNSLEDVHSTMHDYGIKENQYRIKFIEFPFESTRSSLDPNACPKLHWLNRWASGPTQGAPIDTYVLTKKFYDSLKIKNP